MNDVNRNQGRGDCESLVWPTWPASSAKIESEVLQILRSGRWAISGVSRATGSRERIFAEQFADFLGVASATPTASGSSALVVALEAAGIGYGDEVLVPGLAWVACASAVVRVGAIPIFVDIDPVDFAMDPVAAASLVGPNTVGILVTHLSSSVADLDAFTGLCERQGLLMVEDCSQAHGAMWRGRRVGSFGVTAAFSFQSSKLLTAGEGGAAVTRSPELARAMDQIRADGREWALQPEGPGFPDLTAGADRQGHNYCMTEMQAAILSCGLEELDAQNSMRGERIKYLEAMLESIDGVRTVRRRNDERVDIETFWHLPVQIDPEEFGDTPVEQVRSELSHAVELFLEPLGQPMPLHPLYRPHMYHRFPSAHIDRLTKARYELRGAQVLSDTCFTIPHHAFLADERTLEQLAERMSALQHHLRRNNSVDRSR